MIAHVEADQLADRPKPAAEVAGLPTQWVEVISDRVEDSYWWDLIEWLSAERAGEQEVYPPAESVFAAYHLTPFKDVRVFILGQDPYPAPGQAHGLSFSVPRGIAKPRSLARIHKLLAADLAVDPPQHGNLEGWARQGVLLANTALTVRHKKPGSHVMRWKTFTDAVIQALNERSESVVFVLWGADARRKKKLINQPQHRVVEAAHPTSWATAKDPFLASNSFSKIDAHLEDAGAPPINWTNT